MSEKENQSQEVMTSNAEKTNDSEAYLNALRQLEKEKEEVKQAKKVEKKQKRKKRRKKILIAFLIIIGVIILFFSLLDQILAGDSIGNIKDYISNPENRTQSISYLVDEYINYDFHSEEKEMKNLFKLGKQAIEKDDFATAGYLFKICTDFSDEYNEKLAQEIKEMSADEIFLKGARSAAESSDYIIAVELYSAYKGKENIKNEQNEAKYNLAIDYVEKQKYDIACVILEELDGYKYSKELLLWSKVTSDKDYDGTSSARSELKSRLKDPSSYQEGSTRAWSTAIVLEEKTGKLKVQVIHTVSIDYSATNSFGGRLSDTYYWEKNGNSYQVEGYTEKELEDLLAMKNKEVVEKARFFK